MAKSSSAERNRLRVVVEMLKFCGGFRRANRSCQSRRNVSFARQPTSRPSQAQQAVPTAADLILFNGKIVTVDDDFSIKSALVANDGKIIAIGGPEIGQVGAHGDAES